MTAKSDANLDKVHASDTAFQNWQESHLAYGEAVVGCNLSLKGKQHNF